MRTYFPNNASAMPPSKALQKAYDYDESNNLIYEGWALPAKDTSDLVWCIKKYTYDGSNLTAEQWANGNTDFVNSWDDRASGTYV